MLHLAIWLALGQDAAKPPLEIILTPDQESVGLGEQIQVQATLRNTSDKPVTVSPLIFDQRALSFSIQVENSGKIIGPFLYSIVLGSIYAAKPPPLDKLVLRPGKSFESAFLLPATLPGTWAITAKLAGFDSDISSKPVSVKVTAKEGKNKLSVKLTLTYDVPPKDRTMFIELYPDEAPASVMNFAALVQRGFYKDLKAIEVVRNGWIKLGCPFNDGFGDAGYVYPSENKEQAKTPKVKLQFDEGTVALNQQQKLGWQSSQFFITLRRTIYLDYNYTIIGRVDLQDGDKASGILKDVASHAEPDRDTNRPQKDVIIKEMVLIVR